jgi:hypothetical protein
MSKPKFTGTWSNQGNSNGVNRGHEFTVQPMAESFGWQGQARYGRQGGRWRRSGDALVGDFPPLPALEAPLDHADR